MEFVIAAILAVLGAAIGYLLGVRRATAAEAELKVVNAKRDEMREEFQAFAKSTADEQAKTLKSQSEEQLKALLNPLDTRLKEFREGLDVTNKEAIKERAQLG